MKKESVYIFLFIILAYCVKADATFPNEYKPIEFNDGGNVLFGKGEYAEYLFFVKPYWTLSPSLYYRKDFKDTTWHALPLGERRYITDAIVGEKSLFLLWTESSDVFVAALDLHILKANNLQKDTSDNKSRFLKVEKLAKPGDLSMNYENRFIDVKRDNSSRSADSDKALFIANGVLYSFSSGEETGSLVKIDENVAGAVLFKSGEYDYASIIDGSAGTYAYFYGNKHLETAGSFNLGSENYFFPLENKIALISGAIEKSNYFYYQLITPGSNSCPGVWLNAKGSCIKINNDKLGQKIFYITGGKNGYFLERIDFSAGTVTKKDRCLLPVHLFEPMALCIDSAYAYAIFRNGLAVISFDCQLLSSDYYSFGEVLVGDISIQDRGKFLVINGNKASVIFSRTENKSWLLRLIWQNYWYYLVVFIVLLLFAILYKMFKSHKRKLSILLDLPSLGIVFFIDRSGKLTEANIAGKKFLNIGLGSPIGKSFQYYCLDDSSKILLEYVNDAFKEKEQVTRKLSVTENGETKELSVKIMTMKNLAGNFKGLIVTILDITEVLERKRLSYWAHLAHDMQTNIAAIKINAEELDLVQEDNIKKQSIIIRQSAILNQRVRDIVTVGRSEAITKELYDSESICEAVKMEFDWSRRSNISFNIEAQKFKAACDKPVLVRAIRNAVENAIRAINVSEGRIVLSCRSDLRYAYFLIKDNGPGIDEETKSKILKPYFTTSRKEGGSGIGTMIMQHAIELHGGDISIESEKGKGTEVIFRIPNNLRNNKR